MIRVRKSDNAPAELAINGYKDDQVKRTILDDQYDKCYICERKVTTDYQVEHLASQSKNNENVNDWTNLYIACNYCNDKKKNSFDDIKRPSTYNVEDVIVHRFDAMNERLVFETTSEDPGVLQTIKLLERMFNGTNAPNRVLMETRFYNQFKMEYNHFQGVVHDYLSGRADEMRPVIENLISIKSDFLAFKYAVIMANETLRHDFGDKVIWNKNYNN